MFTLEDYYAGLGRFVQKFSEVESTLFVALRLVTDIDVKTFRAMFSGLRARAAMDSMRRHFEAHQNVFPTDLDKAFNQLAAINTARDLILHAGLQAGEAGYKVTNALRSHSKRSLRSIPASVELLQAMTHDLETIDAAITVAVAPMSAATEVVIRTDPDQLLERSRRPWLYAPEQPTKKRRLVPASPQSATPDQKPSPA